MDFTILHFAIHIVWRANVICTCRKSGIARKTTVAYPELRLVVSKDSIMRMPVPKYKRIWKGEKLSYEVTGNHYKGFGRFVNAIETWSLILFNLSLIIAICFSIIGREWLFTAIALIMWLGRFTAAMTVFRKTSKAMGENLCCYFPIFDFMRPLYSLNLKLSYISRKKSDFTRK